MVFIEKKIDEKIICLHPKHREPLPFFNMLIWFFTLLCSILLLLRSSFKFLLRLKAVSGIFWKIYLTDLFIDKPFQCLLVTLLTFGRELLYVNTSRINVFFLRWQGLNRGYCDREMRSVLSLSQCQRNPILFILLESCL